MEDHAHARAMRDRRERLVERERGDTEELAEAEDTP